MHPSVPATLPGCGGKHNFNGAEEKQPYYSYIQHITSHACFPDDQVHRDTGELLPSGHGLDANIGPFLGGRAAEKRKHTPTFVLF